MYDAVLDLFVLVLDIYWWVVVLSVLMSWLLLFDVVNPGNRFVSSTERVLRQLTDPVLERIRKFLPYSGGIDFSPLVLLLGIFFLSRLIFYYR